MSDDSSLVSRLAAVLAMDMVSYSRLMETDELDTLRRLKVLRSEVIDPSLKSHRGRLVKTTGDGILAEFSSAFDAVLCALAIQKEMANRNAGIEPDRQMLFRGGINLCELLTSDNDVFGDGVNIAARLEGIAPPGGICVSAQVHDYVAGKIDTPIIDMGDQRLKNISRPIRVYRMDMGTENRPAAAARPGSAPAPARRKADGEGGMGRRIVTSPWFFALIGVLLVDILLWVLGPLVSVAGSAPLEGWIARLATVAGLVLVWAVAWLVARWRGRRRNDQIAHGMIHPGGSSPGERVADEIADLTTRMQATLDQLRRAPGATRGRYLYEVPWYVIIGPPGSGKTTALKNCGLRFVGGATDALQGVGGTRNCDWWFTEEAIFLDTAGRYVTQDSDASVDSETWLGFLDLLKKHRPRQPVNGVLVAIGLSDLLHFDDTERRAHAAAIRRRVAELQDRLGVRPPIYLLLTKADLMAGFMEFFENFGREERGQVWGVTFPEEGEGGPPPQQTFGAEFEALVKRLGERWLERINDESDIARRVQILSVLPQFGLLRAPVQELIDEAFPLTRFEQRPLLRGVYFTSGTQTGTPIDRLMTVMAQTFGLPRVPQTAHNGHGRSYFLTRLLSEVVLPEAGLVSFDRAHERRSKWLRIGVAAASLTALLAAVGLLAVSYFGNVALVDRVAAAANAYRLSAGDLDPAHLTADQLSSKLDRLRTLPTGYEENRSVPTYLTFGLYQGDKLGLQAATAYSRGLAYMLTPWLLYRLEGQMRQNINNTDFLFEALRVYMMLGNQLAEDPRILKTWYASDLGLLLAAPDQAPLRAALGRHIDALITWNYPSAPVESGVQIDTALVAQVRAVLARVSPAQRAYALLKASTLSRDQGEWTIANHAGPAAVQVLRRLSGQPLTAGVPGLYTRDGFYRAVLEQVPEVTAAVVSESAVYGQAPAGLASGTTASATLSRDVLALYYQDYERQWDSLLADVVVVPFGTVQQAADAINILSSPTSPLKLFLTSAAAETMLTQLPAAPAPAGTTAAPPAAAGTGVADRAIAKVLGANADPSLVPGRPVEDHFRALRAAVQGTPSQLDTVLATLGQLYGDLNAVASGNQSVQQIVGGTSAGRQLAGLATTMPAPIGPMLGRLAQNSAATTTGGARAQIAAQWQSNVLPFCTQIVSNRYPFAADATGDTPLEDFARLFGPHGLILDFFNTSLARYVDTTRRPWRWQRVGDADLGFSAEALAQFERAMAINRAFFAGGDQPKVEFDLSPLSLDASVNQESLRLDGQTLDYAHGPVVSQHMRWPNPQGGGQATLDYQPQPAGRPGGATRQGPWAMFRLFDLGQLRSAGSPEQYQLRFSIDGRTATFSLVAGSIDNPFDTSLVKQFRCPPTL